MPTLVVETTEGVRLPHEIAGAGSRGAAAVIDLALWLGSLLFAVSLLVGVARLDPTGASRFVLGLLAGGGLLLLVVYHLAFSYFWDGRTPGKAVVGLRVRDAQGRPPRFTQLLLRSLFVPLELVPAPVPIGFAILASSARGQRLGDVVADTLVLRDPPVGGAPEPFVGQTHAALKQRTLALTPAIAGRFDVGDRHLLRSLLAADGVEVQSWRRLLLAGGRHYAEVLGVPPPTGSHEAAALLKELYLYLRERR